MSRTCSSRNQESYAGQSSVQFGKGVTMTRSHRFARLSGGILSWGLLIMLTWLTPASAFAQMQQDQTMDTPSNLMRTPHRLQPMHEDTPSPTTMQKKTIVYANFQKSKGDAAELATLAKELREQLNKPNSDVLSPEVTDRAEKIEKLAKKIREEAEGF